MIEFGPQVKMQIANLFNNEEWGDLQYDVTISREGRAWTRSTPSSPTPRVRRTRKPSRKPRRSNWSLVDKGGAEDEYDLFRRRIMRTIRPGEAITLHSPTLAISISRKVNFGELQLGGGLHVRLRHCAGMDEEAIQSLVNTEGRSYQKLADAVNEKVSEL